MGVGCLSGGALALSWSGVLVVSWVWVLCVRALSGWPSACGLFRGVSRAAVWCVCLAVPCRARWLPSLGAAPCGEFCPAWVVAGVGWGWLVLFALRRVGSCLWVVLLVGPPQCVLCFRWPLLRCVLWWWGCVRPCALRRRAAGFVLAGSAPIACCPALCVAGLLPPLRSGCPGACACALRPLSAAGCASRWGPLCPAPSRSVALVERAPWVGCRMGSM